MATWKPARGRRPPLVGHAALRRVGLGLRSGRRGLYLFPHALASRRLAAKCQIKVIADVLGDKSTETTMEYTSIDLVETAARN